MRGVRTATTALALALLAPAGPARAECFALSPGCERLPRLFEDLSARIVPLLEEFSLRLDPYLGELGRIMGDISGWEAPEVLPNGDILIRRRVQSPDESSPESSPDSPPDGTQPPLPSDSEPFEL